MNRPYLALRIDHLFAPYTDEDACRAIADIFARPCFQPLAHLALSPFEGETIRHGPLDREVFLEFMADPRCDSVDIEPGRYEPYIASARLATGRLNERFEDIVTTEISGVVLPGDAALVAPQIDAFCALAVQLRPVVGCVSMEPDMGMASTFRSGVSPPRLAKALTMPGFTERRVRERSAYSDHDLPLERQLWGPEWGLFLSRGHLARVSAPELASSGAFARVEQLADDLVYIQLTDDPMDTLRNDYDETLDRARAVLAPVLTDASQVIVE